ncbi:uncharacterized protein LOC115766435 [Drosophila novamexicana]|uniref:uncharacterized protein LOC115766435 n=1 Tax=Drosophila novamexicana TaxID=47314 RepID=UPI0011E5EC05|nr:uncharacterized protein LOC115766435 [Drosophila novamexicana]
MEMQSLTALLSICLCLTFSSGLGEDNALVQGPNYVPNSCMVPDMGLGTFRYPGPQKQLELKLEFQPQSPQLLQSSVGNTERLFEYGSNPLICSAATYKDVSYEKSMPSGATVNEDDYDDNDDASDEDNNNDDVDDDGGKNFTARVKCLLRTLYENTRLLSDDLKALESGLLPGKSSASPKNLYQGKKKCSKSSGIRERPIKLDNAKAQENNYLNVVDNDADGIDKDESKSKSIPNLSDSSSVQKAKLQAEAETKKGLSLLQQQPDLNEAPFSYVQLPFVLPSTRIIVPPLLQLLTRRSVLPWSIRGPNLIQSRRYLHALNDLRLARAVQAATVARFRQQQNNVELQQHVEEFKENLRRLVSNRAAIERRVSDLLSGITRDVVAA